MANESVEHDFNRSLGTQCLQRVERALNDMRLILRPKGRSRVNRAATSLSAMMRNARNLIFQRSLYADCGHRMTLVIRQRT